MLKLEALRTCDILLYKGTDFTSRLIQWGTESRYNHVTVVVDPAINLAIESNAGHQSGVRALDLRKLDDMGIDVFRVRPAHPYNSAKTISYLVSCLGAGYDWGGVLCLGVLKLLHLKEHSNPAGVPQPVRVGVRARSRKAGRATPEERDTPPVRVGSFIKWQKDRDYFCSELCYAAFNEGGLDIVPQVAEADVTSPGDIAQSERIEKINLA